MSWAVVHQHAAESLPVVTLRSKHCESRWPPVMNESSSGPFKKCKWVKRTVSLPNLTFRTYLRQSAKRQLKRNPSCASSPSEGRFDTCTRVKTCTKHTQDLLGHCVRTFCPNATCRVRTNLRDRL